MGGGLLGSVSVSVQVPLQPWISEHDLLEYYAASLNRNPSEWAIHLLCNNRHNPYANPNDKYVWEHVSAHSSDAAIRLLVSHPNRIHWLHLCSNTHPMAIQWIQEQLERETKECQPPFATATAVVSKICWVKLCKNPAAMSLIHQTHPDNIVWSSLSKNPHDEAIDLLAQHVDKVYWHLLALNRNGRAIRLLQQHVQLDDICWSNLSENDCDEAMQLLKANPTRIDWSRLSKNAHPEAINMLKANLDKIHWDYLCLNQNPQVMEMLRYHPDNIRWCLLAQNPAIFVTPE